MIEIAKDVTASSLLSQRSKSGYCDRNQKALREKVMDLGSYMMSTALERQAVKPIWLCQNVEGQGLFALVEGVNVLIRIDNCRGKVNEETARRLCAATGLQWLAWSTDFRNYWLRQCTCGMHFISQCHNRKFCSSECYSRSATNRQKAYRAASKSERQLKIKRLECGVCGNAMDGVRLSKQFCSARCRQVAVRKWYTS